MSQSARRWCSLARLSACLIASLPAIGSQAAEPAAKPATVPEAAAVLDLQKFPLLPEAKTPGEATLAGLTYSAPGKIAAAFEFQKQTLGRQGWKELPGSSNTEQYASGTFAKNGYTLSVSVIPETDGVMVSLHNHGNIDLGKFAVPPGAKPFYSGPINRLFLTEAAPDETKAAYRKILEAQGWKPYGDAGDTQYYKLNAVRLDVTIGTAPAQDNKTMISLFSTLMSVDLPAPAGAEQLQYSDSTSALSFDTSLSMEEVSAFYREALSAEKWQATSDKPFKVDFRYSMIFRNPAMDLIELTLQEFEGKTRVRVVHETAAIVADKEAKAKTALAKKMAAENAPKPQVELKIPTEATPGKASKTSLEIEVKSGAAKGIVDAWKTAFTKDGWKANVPVMAKEAGSVDLVKGDITLSVTYIDPGFIPGEISVRILGGELKTSKADEKK